MTVPLVSGICLFILLCLFKVFGGELGFEACAAEAEGGQFRLPDAAVDELLDDVVGMVSDVIGVAVSNNLALVQHDNAVADLVGAVHVVGYDHTGHFQLSLQLQNEFVDNIRGDRIQAGRRLVVQNDFRIQGDRAGQGDTFFLPAGQRCRIIVLKSVHPDQCQLLLNQLVQRFVIGDFVMLANREGNVFINRQAVEQGAHLKTKAVPGADRGKPTLVQVIDPFAFEIYGALAGPLQGDQMFHEYGLAAAGRADDDGGFALGNRQRDIVQHQSAVIAFGQVLDDENAVVRLYCFSYHVFLPQSAQRIKRVLLLFGYAKIQLLFCDSL